MTTPEVDQARIDGALVNLFTGMGVAGKDKKLGNQVNTAQVLSAEELEQLYKNGLIRRYVDAIPEASLRHRPTIGLASEDNPDDLIPNFETHLKSTGFYPALREVMQLQRIYGGAGLVLLIDDGLTPEQPVDPARIRNVRGYVALSRHELIPEDTTLTDYSRPTHYRITTNQKLEEDQTDTFIHLQIHHTRVARFDGLYLPWNLRSRNTGWGQSVIEVIWDAWQDYVGALHGLNALVGEGDLLVHQIPGLMQRIAAGGEADIRKRLELNNLARSVYGTFVLDKEEALTNLSRNLTNLSNATEPFVKHLQAVTGWPASILMGDSPGGLGKEGRFEERVWASLVEQWHEVYCREPITQIFALILASREGPAKGRPPSDWEVHFPSVFTETDKERAELRQLTAQSDAQYLQLGVLNPIEVRSSRFGTTEFTLDTTLNDAVTQQLIATTDSQFEAQMIGLEAQKQAALAPPEDETATPTSDPASDPATPTPAASTKTDTFDLYEAHGLRIRVLYTSGNVRAGHLVGPDGQRTDTSDEAPLMIFGPHRARAYKLYRVNFQRNDELIPGPYLTGFASLRAARLSLAALFPGQNVAGMAPLPEDVAASLRAGWDTY